MVNEIYMDGGRKKARPVTNRADYMAQRNHPDNVKNFYDARGGDQKAKARQRQYNYGDLLPDGVVAIRRQPSRTTLTVTLQRSRSASSSSCWRRRTRRGYWNCRGRLTMDCTASSFVNRERRFWNVR